MTARPEIDSAWQWIRHNRIMLVTALLLTGVLFIITLPPHANTFETQFQVKEVVRFLVPTVVFPELIVSEILLTLFPENSYGPSELGFVVSDRGLPFFVTELLLALSIGVVIGTVLQFTWKRSATIVKAVIATIMVGSNLCLAFLLLTVSDGPVAIPLNGCEMVVDTQNGIRFKGYVTGAFSDLSFLLSTSDGGRSWHQFAYRDWFLPTYTAKSYEGIRANNCGMDYFDGEFFWMVMEEIWIYTRDGGQTWQFWGADPQHYIQSVNFTSLHDGVMEVAELHWEDHLIVEVVYHTADGGKTWVRQ